MSPTTALVAFAAFLALCAVIAGVGVVWVRERRRRAREQEIVRITTLLAHADRNANPVTRTDDGPHETDGEPTRDELVAMLHELRQPRPGLMRRTVTAPVRSYTATATAGQAHGQKFAAWIKAQRDEERNGPQGH